MYKFKMGCAVLSACAMLALSAAMVAADDETGDTSVSVRAAIDAASCATSPQTVTMLGLTIDITKAVFNGSDDSSDDGSGDDGGGGGSATDCASLTAGQVVDVGLSSNAAPLTAATVDDSGDGGVKIQGPIDAIDTAGEAITVLGLSINMASAHVDGADDDSADGTSQVIDLTTLVVGQIIEVQLDNAQLPSLVATEAVVKNFANQVEVDVEDSTGTAIDDETDDISTDAADTVSVQTPSGTGMMKKVMHLRVASHGGVTLSGLPTGRAKISVKRTVNGRSHKKTVRVSIQPNTSQRVRVKF